MQPWRHTALLASFSNAAAQLLLLLLRVLAPLLNSY
jgi:hypothetical protein